MAKRFVYFDYKNTMYVKTVDVPWDKDSMEVNRVLCTKEIQESLPSIIAPAIPIDSYSPSNIARSLLTTNLFISNRSVKDCWKELIEKYDTSKLPPGSLEYVYICSLSSKQLYYILSIKSCYDLFFNEDKQVASPAKAVIACKMLYNQNKYDYLADMNKFLHWYFINCARPVEWSDKYIV